jgi:hypothetical protein
MLKKQEAMPIHDAQDYIKKLHYDTIPQILKDNENRFLDENDKIKKEYRAMINKYNKEVKKLTISERILTNNSEHTKSCMNGYFKPNDYSFIKFPPTLLFYVGLLRDISMDILDLTIMFPDSKINEIRYTNDIKKVEKYLSNYKEISKILDNGICTLEILINEYQDVNSLK